MSYHPMPPLGQAAMAASLPVVLASDQSTINVTFTGVGGLALDATMVAMSAKLPATLGQKAMAASMSVTLASDQSSLPVTVGNFPATQPVSIAAPVAVTGTFWQATQPVSIAGAVAVTGPLTDAQLRAVAVPVSGTFWQATQPVSGPLTDAQLRAVAVPVSGTFWQATQPVSAASLPLPTGAATEATLAAASAKLPATLGQKAMAASMAVVIASDQSAVPVSGPLTDAQLRATPVPMSLAAGAAAIAKAEDVASANADVGVPMMATQRVAPSNQADTNGDYEILQCYQGGLWVRRPNVIGTAATITALDVVVAAPGGLGVTLSGSSTAGSIVAEAEVGGNGSFAALVTGGSFTGTIHWEGSVNSGNGTTGSWVSIPMRREGVWEGQQLHYGHSAAGASSNSLYRGSCAGFTYVRARLVGTVHTTSPTVSLVLSAGSGLLAPSIVPTTMVDPGATYRGACATFRTPGIAGTAGQKIFAIHNATGSTKIVKVKNLYVDHVETVIKAVTVLPPVVRAHRVTVLPTNGTAGSKVARDSGMTSSASVTVFQGASADGTASGTALTATIPAGSCIAQEFAPRMITAAGYEAADRIHLLRDDEVVLRALEGIVVFLDYVLATQNPVTDMWTVSCDWEEK